MSSSLPIAPTHLGNKLLFGGVDEVGYGCFAGPVVSALVILPNDFESELINDSKSIKKEEGRRFAYNLITEAAIAYSVQVVSVKMINKIGIVKATMLSMQKCIDDIKTKPEFLLVDGNKWEEYNGIPYETVVKGDATYLPIAAASILAKVRRDDYMAELGSKFPAYDWGKNKGYGTPKHRVALKEHGATDYHRTQYVRNHI